MIYQRIGSIEISIKLLDQISNKLLESNILQGSVPKKVILLRKVCTYRYHYQTE